MRYPEFVQFRAPEGTVRAILAQAELEGVTTSEILRRATLRETAAKADNAQRREGDAGRCCSVIS